MLTHEFRNGIVSAPRPPKPPVGSYVRQLIRLTDEGTHLPWYFTPPSAGIPDRVSGGLDAGTVFGPVHEAEETLATLGLISVLVPVPVGLLSMEDRVGMPDLIWVNIYTNRRHGREVSHHYCEQVSDAEVQSWHGRGWQDAWFPTASSHAT